MNILFQTFQKSAPSRLELDEELVAQLKHSLSDERLLSANLFDALQLRCFNAINTGENYLKSSETISDATLYPGFRCSKYYITMLNNLDLMNIEKNDQIILDDVIRITGLLKFCPILEYFSRNNGNKRRE